MADLSLSASRKLFAALFTLPLAAAFSSTSLLFLPGAPWNQDQRLVSSMGQVFLLHLPNKYQIKSENFGLMFSSCWEGRNSYNVGSNLYLDHEMRFAESIFGIYAWRKYSALESDEYGAELVRLLFPFNALNKVRAWC
jgi:hypothetical protein